MYFISLGRHQRSPWKSAKESPMETSLKLFSFHSLQCAGIDRTNAAGGGRDRTPQGTLRNYPSKLHKPLKGPHLRSWRELISVDSI